MHNFNPNRNIFVGCLAAVGLMVTSSVSAVALTVDKYFQPVVMNQLTMLQSTVVPTGDLTPKFFVHMQGQLRGYVEAPRLSLLLYQAGNGWYWPTAQLYRVNTDKTQQLEASKKNVLEQLRLLTLHWHLQPDVAQQFMALRNVIQHWRIGEPLALVLDPDALVLRPELDKALDVGHYVLEVHKKIDYVTFVGLGGEQKINQQGELPAYAYLEKLPMSGWRDSDEIWLVQSRASLQRPQPPLRQAIPVASWNKTAVTLSVGALLYVPVPQKYLPEPWQDLNEQLLDLIEHRIYP